MSYGTDDLRSTLAAAPIPTGVAGRRAQYFDFSQLQPDEITPRGSRTWIVRSEALVVFWTDAVVGDTFELELVDESVVVVPEPGAVVEITAGSASLMIRERSFASVPDGPSAILAMSSGPILRVASARNAEQARRARNASEYERPDPVVAPWTPWPVAPGGSRLRAYALSDWPVMPGRFGRIFRNSTTMVNFLPDETAPRDRTKLSPHHHDDFEQISFGAKGRYRHHLRYPWGPDSTAWNDDEHVEMGSPSVAIIPPPVIHTSEGLGSDQQLIDIFGPPRSDFVDAGWVVNESDLR